MNVASWYDQGLRLSGATADTHVASWYDQGVRLKTEAPAVLVESWYDGGVRINLPTGMSASAAVASPELLEKALSYESDIAEMTARMDAFPKKEGTMFGILRDKLKLAESMLAQTIESAREAEDAINDEEGRLLAQRLNELQMEMNEVTGATQKAEADAAAAAELWDDRRVRLQTDFDNLQARHANQTFDAQMDATVKLLQEFLPVLDSFDRARSSIVPDGEVEEAVEMRYNAMRADLMTALSDLGVERIPTVGEDFDYNLHMAIQTVPSDEYEEDKVADEMQAGFTCKGRLVRPAYVMVSSG